MFIGITLVLVSIGLYILLAVKSYNRINEGDDYLKSRLIVLCAKFLCSAIGTVGGVMIFFSYFAGQF